MKANRKAREDKNGITAVVGTMLMLPIVLMILSFMIMWGNDLVNQLKKFQDKLKGMQDDVEDLDTDIRFLGRNKNIVWKDDFEDVRLDNYEFKNVWNIIDNTPPTAECVKETVTSYSAIHCIKITTASGGANGLEKCFGGRSSANKVAVELAFTIDEFGNEEYKQITIKEKDPAGADMNIAKIQIYASGKLYYFDSSGNNQLIHDVGDLLADKLGWHTIKFVVNFAHEKTEDPHYDSLTFNGEVFNIDTDLDAIPSSDDKDKPKGLCIEIISKAKGGVSSTSYIDDFILRDYALSGYENDRPETPTLSADPTSGESPLLVEFTVFTTDPERDIIFYEFDWNDDGTVDKTVGSQPDEEVKVEHTFTQPNSYHVRVRARDVNDNYTPWSDPVDITVTSSP